MISLEVAIYCIIGTILGVALVIFGLHTLRTTRRKKDDKES